MTVQCPHATYTWMPWNFLDSLTTPIATIPNIFHGHSLRSNLQIWWWRFYKQLKLYIGSCGMRLYITGPRETGFPESAAALGGIGRWLRTYTSFFKGYGSRKLLVEFLEIKWNERGFNSLLENIRETESTDRRHGSGRPKHARTEENVTTDRCWWAGTKPGGPATNTSFNMSDIVRDRSNMHRPVSYISFVAILGLNFLKCPKSRRAQELTAAIVSFS